MNVRSLQNKMVEVKTFISNMSPTILGISECEIGRGDNFDEKILYISGYNIFFQ